LRQATPLKVLRRRHAAIDALRRIPFADAGIDAHAARRSSVDSSVPWFDCTAISFPPSSKWHAIRCEAYRHSIDFGYVGHAAQNMQIARRRFTYCCELD
jgi:hypothetical protein